MRAIFIGGCGRSGTTLLGSMLGVHPDHLATPETGFKRRLLAPSLDTRLDGQEALALLGNEFHFQT